MLLALDWKALALTQFGLAPTLSSPNTWQRSLYTGPSTNVTSAGQELSKIISTGSAVQIYNTEIGAAVSDDERVTKGLSSTHWNAASDQGRSPQHFNSPALHMLTYIAQLTTKISGKEDGKLPDCQYALPLSLRLAHDLRTVLDRIYKANHHGRIVAFSKYFVGTILQVELSRTRLLSTSVDPRSPDSRHFYFQDPCGNTIQLAVQPCDDEFHTSRHGRTSIAQEVSMLEQRHSLHAAKSKCYMKFAGVLLDEKGGFDISVSGIVARDVFMQWPDRFSGQHGRTQKTCLVKPPPWKLCTTNLITLGVGNDSSS
nr:hypothetical protein CFP56_31807 [Quercus suber]